MKDAALLLDLPAARAVRWLGLHWLSEARAAHARLGQPEGLHDFRVAVRRLRSTLEAYRGEVRGLARGKDIERLRRVARATSDARDAEVQLAWLDGRGGRARGAERDGVAWSRQRVEASAEKAGGRAASAAEAFPRVAGRLERRLGRYRSRIDLEDPREQPAFRVVLARHLAECADALRDALAAVTGEDRQDEAHRARIAAKRLRYLLEPVGEAIAGGREMVGALRGLQDGLGDLRDLHLMWSQARASLEGAEAAPAGAEALLARLQRERRQRFVQVRRGWLDGAAAPLLERIGEAAAALAGPRADREIERKYLLRAMPRLTGLEVRRYRLEQGYLPGKHLVERVRRERGPDGARHYRTVKLGTGLSRVEVEEACDEAVFRTLWRLTAGRRVRKVRYRVADGERVWEIDRFLGRALVLAEVELPDEHTPVIVPTWLRNVVEREVTGEAAYVNVNLAG